MVSYTAVFQGLLLLDKLFATCLVVTERSLVVLEAWSWPRGSSRTPFGSLGIGLEWPGPNLGFGNAGLHLGLEEKVLAVALDRGDYVTCNVH